MLLQTMYKTLFASALMAIVALSQANIYYGAGGGLWGNALNNNWGKNVGWGNGGWGNNVLGNGVWGGNGVWNGYGFGGVQHGGAWAAAGYRAY